MADRPIILGIVAVSALMAHEHLAVAQVPPDDSAQPTTTDPVAETPTDQTTTSETPTEETAPAEETSLVPKVSGFVNATYNFNVRNPTGMDSGTNGGNGLHVYDAIHNNLQLDTAHVAFTGASGGLSYDVELDMGLDAIVNSLGDDDFDIQEAWVSYVSASKVGFKAGKFVTYNGIEVVESPANPTISRGLLFGFAEPVSHVGALLTYQLSDTMDLAIGAVNGWDLVIDNNKAKTIVGKFGMTAPILLTFSALAGPEQTANNDDWRTTFDVTGMAKAGMIDLWFQANVGFEQGASTVNMGDDGLWYGAGVQPVFHLSDKFALGTRAEVLLDPEGARFAAGDLTVFNVSVAPAFTIVPGLTVRGEARLDFASEDVFVVDQSDTDDEPVNNQIVLLAEAIVAF